MAVSKSNTGIVPVDVGRLSGGLQTMFNGMSEVFGSIGAGEDAVAMINAKAEKAQPVEQVPASEQQVSPKPEPKPVEPEPEPVPKAEPTPKAEPKKTEAPASTLTLVDLQKIAGQKILANRANQEKIQKIISSFGIAKLSDLPENKYEAFMTQLTTL